MLLASFLIWSNCSPKRASSDNWLNIFLSSKGFQLLDPDCEFGGALLDDRKGFLEAAEEELRN